MTLLYSKEALLWKFIVAGISEIYLRLYVKYTILFPGCNQMRILLKIFSESSQYLIPRQSLYGSHPHTYERTDGRTDGPPDTISLEK